jgi:diguanylate cyclase (GGDEF)-like protein
VDADRDPGYLRFRRNSVRLASATSLTAVTIMGGYVAATWDDRAHSGLLAGLIGSVVVIVALVELARAERLVETRWCDLFFGVWSTAYVLVISAFALLDGGTASPLALTFFPVIVFSGLCYPLRLSVYIGSACVGAYVAVGLLASDEPAVRPLYVGGVLALTATMAAWQSQTLERARRELATASRTDHLTGSLNRRGFHERVEAELARAERADDHLALVLVDLDGFKNVNDRDGHAAGDELLCWVVERLRLALRPSDAAGRLGGDEFALLLPGIDAEGAQVVVERLRRLLAQRTSASFGTATFPARRSAEALLAYADDELYLEKRAHRAGPDAGAAAIHVPDGFWA